MFQFLILGALFFPMLQGQVTIGRITNDYRKDAYLIVPGVERESVTRSAKGEILAQKPSLLESVKEATLPVYKAKDAYVLHALDERKEPLKLSMDVNEPFYIATDKGMLELLGQSSIEAIEISDKGIAKAV